MRRRASAWRSRAPTTSCCGRDDVVPGPAAASGRRPASAGARVAPSARPRRLALRDRAGHRRQRVRRVPPPRPPLTTPGTSTCCPSRARRRLARVARRVRRPRGASDRATPARDRAADARPEIARGAPRAAPRRRPSCGRAPGCTQSMKPTSAIGAQPCAAPARPTPPCRAAHRGTCSAGTSSTRARRPRTRAAGGRSGANPSCAKQPSPVAVRLLVDVMRAALP